MGRPSIREKIVEAALDRFHALGYNACGVQEIVEAAGALKGSFYNHFKSKEAMAVEAIARYSERVRLEMLEDEARDPVQRLRDHFEFLTKWFVEQDFERGCLVATMGSELSNSAPLVREAAEQALARWCELVEKIMREAARDGRLARELEPARAARFLVNAWEGAVLRMKIVKNREPLDDFFEVVFRSILH
ncbi:TetR/AcrR family transcriptional regulator [Archangium lipolyticum]|uniref:TetR/AcrR family transcriptional regulator n=1 Tax=Archangium lipolyticum TaxID=2970465 RepID=UPI002149A5FB|nr:TetR/AcrR family transcriptional regulator [Archangium lipolyticum]